MAFFRAFIVVLLLASLLLHAVVVVDASSELGHHKEELVQVMSEVPRRSLLATINCGSACSRRCSKSSRLNLCHRACGTCCARCNCVPSGTYGNYQQCPCYASLTTHGGRKKCP